MDQNMPPQNTMPQDNFQAEMPQKSSKVWMIIAILLALALVAVSVFGYYKWQQYKKLVGSLGADVNSLNAQVAALNAQILSLSKSVKSNSSQTNVSVTEDEMISASADSFCVGNNNESCSAKVVKKSAIAADVVMKNGKHILMIKNNNGSWMALIGPVDNVCTIGTDGIAATAIGSLCKS